MLDEKILAEFELVKEKWAYKMKDLTFEEIALVKIYLKLNNIKNLFNDEDWPTKEIVVREWRWRDVILIDIFGYPGDNEDGAIFLDNKHVINNGDMDLVWIRGPKELRSRIPYLMHLRPNGWGWHGICNHSQCKKQHGKYVKMLDVTCLCEICSHQ